MSERGAHNFLGKEIDDEFEADTKRINGFRRCGAAERSDAPGIHGVGAGVARRCSAAAVKPGRCDESGDVKREHATAAAGWDEHWCEHWGDAG
jgi:hypothetical protein